MLRNQLIFFVLLAPLIFVAVYQLRQWWKPRRGLVSPTTGLRPSHTTPRRASRWGYWIFGLIGVAIFINLYVRDHGSPAAQETAGAIAAALHTFIISLFGICMALMAVVIVLHLVINHDPVLKQVAKLAIAEKYDEAIERLRDHIRNKGENAKRLNALGLLYLTQKQYPAALEQFERSAQLDPRAIDTTNNRAVALCKLGRTDEGLALMAELSRSHPKQLLIACNHSLLLADAGRETQAYEELERAETIVDRFHQGRLSGQSLKMMEECRQRLPTARGFPVIVRESEAKS